MIDRSLVYPQDRINTQVIYRFALAQVGCTSYCLLTNCKQKITSLSLFVGTPIQVFLFKCEYASPSGLLLLLTQV